MRRAIALPDALFDDLYGPPLERLSNLHDHTADAVDIHRALLSVVRLRASVVIPRGLHPEDAVRQYDTWTYVIVTTAIRAFLGFLSDEVAAKRWVIEFVPDSGRRWLPAELAESLLLHCQGRTRVQDPILSIILRAFTREDSRLGIPVAVDSIYARASANETKHDRFGADLYFPADCCVMTRKRFNSLSFSAFSCLTDTALIDGMNATGIPVESVDFAISNSPDKRVRGLCIRRASDLPPYPDLAFS